MGSEMCIRDSLHTGDWKIDPNPQIGDPVDEDALRKLGKAGVLAMICDSTNVFTPGEAGSEEGVRAELTKLIAEYDGRGVAVASFASNVARLESVMLAARENNRSVCLIGRSMKPYDSGCEIGRPFEQGRGAPDRR